MATLSKVFGVDVSRWQPDFNFGAAKKEGAEFAVLRGAYSAPAVVAGGGADTSFARHFKAASDAGLHVGIYQYSMAQSEAEAVAEAIYLEKNCLSGRRFALPVFIDVEDSVQKKLSKRVLTDIVKAWCTYLEKHGFFVGIYSSKSFFQTQLYDGELTGYTHWVAQWASACTYTPVSSLGMWQFGGETNILRSNKVAGVVCDQNYMLTDYPSKIAALGLNGFDAPAAVSREAKLYGTNIQRGRDMLVQYIGISSTGTNRYGTEVAVDKNGIVLQNPVYGVGNMTVLPGGRVLSGHGRAAAWLLENVKAGYSLWADSTVHVYPGVRRSIDGVNAPRGKDQLIMYRAPVEVAATNRYGYEVAVDRDGRAAATPVYGTGRTAVPSGGFVLSGHGNSGAWLFKSIRRGSAVAVKDGKYVIVG